MIRFITLVFVFGAISAYSSAALYAIDGPWWLAVLWFVTGMLNMGAAWFWWRAVRRVRTTTIVVGEGRP